MSIFGQFEPQPGGHSSSDKVSLSIFQEFLEYSQVFQENSQLFQEYFLPVRVWSRSSLSLSVRLGRLLLLSVSCG